jgi:hypothetical protein
MLQTVASLTSVIDDTVRAMAKAKASADKTFIVSLTIVTYDSQNIFIVQATAVNVTKQFLSSLTLR